MDFKGLHGSSYVRGIALNVPPDFTPELLPFPQRTYSSHPGLAWPISIAPAKAGKSLDAAIRLYSFRPHNLK
jgi:hypothetical protein